MIRYATIDGLDGVPENLITDAALDPNGRELVSPTEDALLSLRPNGYRPVYVSGKVWLAKVAKPFSEEDAAERIRSANLNGSLSSADTGSSAMGHTYAPRAPHIAAANDTVNEPLSQSGFLTGAPVASVADTAGEAPSRLGFLAIGNSRIPAPTHAGSGRVHRTIPPGFSNCVPTKPIVHPQAPQPLYTIAPRQVKQLNKAASNAPPTPIQAPKPQAARRAVPALIREASRAPAYRSSWRKKHVGLTREAYNRMDTGEKKGALEMLDELP
jgi:hypothetical protein